jgi:hypothetical protein
MNEHDKHSSQIRKHNYVMWIFMSFIVYLLITEHWAHILPYLPWLILLACPLMHIFMHGGHDHGSGHDPHSHDKEE